MGRFVRMRELWLASALLSLVAAGSFATATPFTEEKPKRDKPADPFSEVDELLRQLPPGAKPEQVARIRKEMERVREQMTRQIEGMRAAVPGGGFNPYEEAFPGRASSGGRPGRADLIAGPDHIRLGVFLQKPTETLADQLELPRDQGVVVARVFPDTPASRAGLKVHDILLELAGKKVPDDPRAMSALLDGIETSKPVDALVLRRGKKETVRGLVLHPGNSDAPGGRSGQGAVEAAPGFPGAGSGPGPGRGAGDISSTATQSTTSVARINDELFIRHDDGTSVISVTATMEDGKVRPDATRIKIRSKAGAKAAAEFSSLDKVPEELREKVRKLIENAEKGKSESR